MGHSARTCRTGYRREKANGTIACKRDGSRGEEEREKGERKKECARVCARISQTFSALIEPREKNRKLSLRESNPRLPHGSRVNTTELRQPVVEKGERGGCFYAP